MRSSRKEKLLALALDRGATPEGQLAALRYLAMCESWKDVQKVAVTRWWERPECGEGYDTLSPGCPLVEGLRAGTINDGSTIGPHAVHATAEAAAAHMREDYQDDEEQFRENALSRVVLKIKTTPGAGTVCCVYTEIVRPNCRAQIGGGDAEKNGEARDG